MKFAKVEGKGHLKRILKELSSLILHSWIVVMEARHKQVV